MKKLQKTIKKKSLCKRYKEILKFETSYEGLGIDRLACSFQDNCVIVDAGSAITVDIMEEGIHKGGFITF